MSLNWCDITLERDYMKIQALLNSEELSNSEKLSQLTDIVNGARNSYGNADVIIDIPRVNTIDGYVALNMLSDEDKVAVAAIEFKNIVMECVEYSESNNAVILDKSIQEQLAVNAVLTNLSTDSGSQYI